jgi:5-methylcytosine-specific restriction endonuclease McrA
MRSDHKKCLLLNADYSPISIIDWKKAIYWKIKYENNNNYGIEIIDFYKHDYIQCVNNKKHPIPAVAKTKHYFKYLKYGVVFSRKNIFIRDKFTCQYCNKQFLPKDLTYDHVIPKSTWDYSLGSPTNWTNIVTCCSVCNRKKGNKTPKQANMNLSKLPFRPEKTNKYLPIAHKLSNIEYSIPTEWQIYLPQSYFDYA